MLARRGRDGQAGLPGLEGFQGPLGMQIEEKIGSCSGGGISGTACGIWDPLSITDKNDPKNFQDGHTMMGRDGRLWQVDKSRWILEKNNMMMNRFPSPIGMGIPLNELDWWRWSMIPSVESFRVLDCGGGGDCFFHVVGRSLQLDAKQIRIMLAEMVTEDRLSLFLKNELALRKEGGGGVYLWEPTTIQSAQQMQTIIRKLGNTYWGDTTSLELLANHPIIRERRIGFVVFRRDGIVDPRLFGDPNELEYLSLLYNDANQHWRLVTCYNFLLSPIRFKPLSDILQASWGNEYKITLFGKQ